MFFQSFFPHVGGTRKDGKHGSKVKGNTKKELTQLTMGAAGKDPKALILTLFIKVNITVTWHTLKSLALVSGNVRRVYVLLGPAGGIAIFFFVPFFLLHFLSIGGPANLCDSVATECLPAAECSALQQPSPHPPARSLPPCGSLQTGFPPLPSPGLRAKSSSFRTGPPVINLLLLLRQSLSSATSSSTLSVSLLQGSL